MTLQGPKIGKFWYLNGTIALKKVLWALDYVKIGYWASKAQNSSRVAKRALGGPKSENLLYLSNYDSTRTKNWTMLIPNWYNCFKKFYGL